MSQASANTNNHRGFWWLIAFLFFLALAATLRYIQPLPTMKPASLFQAATVSSRRLVWPSGGEEAVGAVGYGLLATGGNQTPRPTASVAKLITSLAVLQKYPLNTGEQGPTLTLTAADVAIYQKYLSEGGSVAAVQAGEHITEYQALEAMMLPSANNMADTLAIWAFGSLPSYSSYANQMVDSMGLYHTHVGSDASGFLPDTTSTATDLVSLGFKVLQNPVLRQIIAEKSATIPVAGVIHNVNYLLGYDGIVGIKTGNSNQAGGVYLFASQKSIVPDHTITIIGAIEGLPTLADAVSVSLPLLNSVAANFTYTTVVKAGQIVGKYVTPWGNSSVPVAASTSLRAVVWGGRPPDVKVDLQALRAPKAKGSAVGSISVSSNTVTVPAVLAQSIPKPTLFWRVLHHNL